MYSFGPTATLRYTEILSHTTMKTIEIDRLGNSTSTISILVGLSILASFVTRSASVPLIDSYSSYSFVMFGLVFLVTGPILLILMGDISLLIPGVVIYSGIGIVTPMSKNGGMLAVNDKELGSYAASLLKIGQLVIGNPSPSHTHTSTATHPLPRHRRCPPPPLPQE